MGVLMKKCYWYKIENFTSLNEFKRFESWIAEQIKIGKASKISVESNYLGASTFEEKWYLCIDCGLKWRLVAPDPPFEGLFEPIAPQNSDDSSK